MKILVTNTEYRNHDAILLHGLKALRIRNDVECPPSLKPFGTIVIHGKSRQMIAVALLNNYPSRLLIWNTSLSVLIEAPEKAFRILKALQRLKKPIRKNEEFYKLLENPTLENVERFVAVRKLMEG